MAVTIIEILGRSDQGRTRPFLCRGDDGYLYYVKGQGAGRKALICEWLAGHMGKSLGLPIPEFQQAVISKRMVALSAREDISEMGVGTGFASRLVENADELSYLYIQQIEPSLRATILLFDWWIANGDRTLTEHGGNPNILWVHRDYRPYVIDHNLAFDPSSASDFWSTHLCASDRSAWDAEFRLRSTELMKAALGSLVQCWEAMPSEWTEVETQITLAWLQKFLWRFEADPAIFWEAQ